MSGHLVGPALVVDGDDLRTLAEFVAAQARRRHLQGPVLSRDERRVAELVLTAAKAWTVPATSGSDPVADQRSEIDKPVSDLGRFTWIDVRDAAAKLRITPRAVCAAIARGALEARRRGRGRGTWQIAEQSLEVYASRRNRTD